MNDAYCIKTLRLCTINSGCGKERRILIGRLELLRGLLALCRRTLGSERHRYAIVRPDKLGTDPMAYGGFQ